MSAPVQSLAAEIEREHQAAIGAARSAIEHAIECGKLLLQAKAEVGHGGWLAWVDVNLSFGDRQARKYMRVAQHADQLANRNCGSDLGINAALELLADPKEPAPAELVPTSVYLAEAQPLADGEVRLAIADVLPAPKVARRSTVNPDHIERMAKYLPDLPPIEVSQRNELIDGWHRVEAHKLAGATTIRATVTHVESELEHLELFCRRNSSHGHPLTLADRDLEVETKLAEDERRSIEAEGILLAEAARDTSGLLAAVDDQIENVRQLIETWQTCSTEEQEKAIQSGNVDPAQITIWERNLRDLARWRAKMLYGIARALDIAP